MQNHLKIYHLNLEGIFVLALLHPDQPKTTHSLPKIEFNATFYCKTKLAPAYANMSSHGF